MGRRKRASSRKSRQEINFLYEQSFEALQAAIKSINQKLIDGKSVSDEEIRLLKKAPDIIKTFQHREENKPEETPLPEGQLKNFVDKHLIMQNKIIEATGNKRYKLTKEAIDDIADRVGYYRCELCGNLHIKSRDCIIDEYVQKISKSN